MQTKRIVSQADFVKAITRYYDPKHDILRDQRLGQYLYTALLDAEWFYEGEESLYYEEDPAVAYKKFLSIVEIKAP